MRNPMGYATWTSPDAPVKERDTYTCGHCNRVKHVEPKQRPEDLGGLCKMCMKLICPVCLKPGTCDPFEKKLERMEAVGRFRRDFDRF